MVLSSETILKDVQRQGAVLDSIPQCSGFLLKSYFKPDVFRCLVVLLNHLLILSGNVSAYEEALGKNIFQEGFHPQEPFLANPIPLPTLGDSKQERVSHGGITSEYSQWFVYFHGCGLFVDWVVRLVRVWLSSRDY